MIFLITLKLPKRPILYHRSESILIHHIIYTQRLYCQSPNHVEIVTHGDKIEKFITLNF